MNDKSEFQNEIETAIAGVGDMPFEVSNKEYVISKVEKIYVEGRPRVWWLSFKHIDAIDHFDDNSGYASIFERIEKLNKNTDNPDKEVYLIADEDEDGNALLVYKVFPNKIRIIIDNCRYFEYYIVADDFSWLIAENDHGDIIECKKPDTEIKPE